MSKAHQFILKKYTNFEIKCQITCKVPKMPQNLYKNKIWKKKHQHQTTFATLKYLQKVMFWNSLLSWKCKKNLGSKMWPKMVSFLGHFFFLPPSDYLGPYSQHFVFILTCEYFQQARVLDYTWPEKLASDKHSS